LLSVYYWDGQQWVTVGAVNDGTSESNVSLAKSGIISWEPPSLGSELPRTIDDSIPLYYYKLVWDQAMDAEVEIDRIFGISEGDTIGAYKFPLMHQNRLLLCSEVEGEKNSIRIGSDGTTDVWNGDDVLVIRFGQEEELTCGASFFSRFGADLYYQAVFCKQNETWLLDGYGVSEYRPLQISRAIGCPAPMTMVVVDIGYMIAPDLLRQVVIWMSASGPVMFDGSSIIPIGQDVSEYWNPQSSDYFAATTWADAYGWYDPQYNAYHLVCNNVELVYSLQFKKWYKINRGSGNELTGGFIAKDTDGRAYPFGFSDNGYMYRLENGTDFDGTDITVYFETVDRPPVGEPPAGSIMNEYTIEFFKLIGVVDSSEDTTIAVTHYADSATSGTSLTAVSMDVSGQRIYLDQQATFLVGTTHRWKCQIALDDANESFEPLAYSIAYKPKREPVML
jgi:hypothetical protein